MSQSKQDKTNGVTSAEKNVKFENSDFVERDKDNQSIQVGNIENATGIAIGPGASVTVNNTILEPAECSLCGRLCLPNEAYRCQRCHHVFCVIHRTNPDSPSCQRCMELVEWETMLSSTNGDHRIEAAKQLCVLKEISTLDVLKKRFILEQNEYVRYWIAYALGKVGGEAAYETLKEAQSREKNPFAQQGIQDALDEIKTSTAFKPKS